MISVLVAALLASAAPADTVFTVDGGRISGTVLEESPATGVTIQTADGTVRKIDRGQVARIEFADGTVSTPTPPPAPAAVAPPPAAPAAAVAKPAVPDGPVDTVFFKGSGRARGTVMEESATSVKVRLLDGSIHTYTTDELVRIEYADGTVSTPRAPPKPPEPAPAPKAKSAEAPLDVVYFLGGGRVRGTVIEENPKTGVKVRLLDGTVQTYSRDELVRIEYADGSVSRRVTPTPAPAPAPAPQSAAPAPPPQPAAVPAPPPAVERKQVLPLYVSLGVGATFLGGDLSSGVPMSDVLETEQVHVSTELGLRFSPSFALGVYGDVSAGDPAKSIRDQCQLAGTDCVGSTGHFGFLARHTWDPLSRRPKWISLGTGWEFADVSVDRHAGNGPEELFSYTGREYVRIGAGVDFRSNDVIALGLYGSFAVGEYDEYKEPAMVNAVSLDRGTHTTAQVGLRLTLFP